jgi:hypothetical protein
LPMPRQQSLSQVGILKRAHMTRSRLFGRNPANMSLNYSETFEHPSIAVGDLNPYRKEPAVR